MEVKLRLWKICSSLLAIVIVLTIFAVLIPGQAEAVSPTFTIAQKPDSYWALMNLTLSIVSVLLAVIMLIRVIVKKNRGDDECEKSDDNEEYNENENKKRTRFIILSAVPVIMVLSLVLFILTQDMNNQMILTDTWTFAHIFLIASELMAYVFLIRENNEYEYAVTGN